jgi:hypothetical protein
MKTPLLTEVFGMGGSKNTIRLDTLQVKMLDQILKSVDTSKMQMIEKISLKMLQAELAKLYK